MTNTEFETIVANLSDLSTLSQAIEGAYEAPAVSPAVIVPKATPKALKTPFKAGDRVTIPAKSKATMKYALGTVVMVEKTGVTVWVDEAKAVLKMPAKKLRMADTSV